MIAASAPSSLVRWHDDWPDVPPNIEVISLKPYCGVPLKIWIQGAIRSQWEHLDKYYRMKWALSTRVTYGDPLRMQEILEDGAKFGVARACAKHGISKTTYRRFKRRLGFKKSPGRTFSQKEQRSIVNEAILEGITKTCSKQRLWGAKNPRLGARTGAPNP
jgi:hypothetical protein